MRFVAPDVWGHAAPNKAETFILQTRFPVLCATLQPWCSPSWQEPRRRGRSPCNRQERNVYPLAVSGRRCGRKSLFANFPVCAAMVYMWLGFCRRVRIRRCTAWLRSAFSRFKERVWEWLLPVWTWSTSVSSCFFEGARSFLVVAHRSPWLRTVSVFGVVIGSQPCFGVLLLIVRGRERKNLTPPGKPFGVSRALVVREPWRSLIVDGAKTWEIRGENTRKRERIANVRLRGANGEWQPCGKLANSPTLPANVDKQCINYLNAIPYQEASAWAVRDAQNYMTPGPYEHKPGCIKWIKLSVPSVGAGATCGAQTLCWRDLRFRFTQCAVLSGDCCFTHPCHLNFAFFKAKRWGFVGRILAVHWPTKFSLPRMSTRRVHGRMSSCVSWLLTAKLRPFSAFYIFFFPLPTSHLAQVALL